MIYRRKSSPSLWEEMDKLQREMNRMFDSAFTNRMGETLTISGSRQAPADGENIRYHRQERGYGSFTRTIQLPFPIDVDKVEANYEKGVLKIWLPRAESDKPRKITVKAI